jgi:hypothetical protein
MEKNKYLPIMAIFLTAILLAIPVMGATQTSQNVSATLTAQAPTIIALYPDNATYDPVEASTRAVTVTVQVYDPDGVANIDNTTIHVNATKTDEPTLNFTTVSCGSPAVVNSTVLNCTATVNMLYYNKDGTWDLSAFAEDIDANSDTETNASAYTYNVLEAWTIDSNAVAFGSFYLTDAISFPDNNVLNNTGNKNNTVINLTAYDLVGVTNSSYSLVVNTTTFRAGYSTVWAEATGLVNATATTISGAWLDIFGSGTGQTETINYGIQPQQFPSNTLAQVYQNLVGQEWLIET